MLRTAFLIALVLAGIPAAGCAQLGNQVPSSMGGLPADVPARPDTVAATPAVHDLPPPRATEPLDSAAQLRLEQDLAKTRAQQDRLQMPNARQRAESASSASSAAREKAKAAAKPPAN